MVASVCFSLFRFVTKHICLFRLFRYRFETPKQTEIFSFWFHETNRNKRETDLVSVCFGSNRNLFLFVSRTPYPSPTGQREKKAMTDLEYGVSLVWTIVFRPTSTGYLFNAKLQVRTLLPGPVFIFLAHKDFLNVRLHVRKI
jgi:hypothetical protein